MKHKPFKTDKKMAWTIGIVEPTQAGGPYVAEISTDTELVTLQSVKYTRHRTTDIELQEDPEGSTSISVNLNEYRFDPNSDAHAITVNVFLGADNKGSENTTVRDDED